MTHASVFSGIGGPEVAAAMLGWENLFHCEINPFGRAVLQYWFPNAKSYEDITTTDFSEWGGRVNVLTGGFPCQPFSYAGQRRGADDDRYLWPFMHRCINQVRPDWVVCENVAGIITMVEQGNVVEMAAEKSLFGEVDTLHRYRLDETFTLERICNDLEGDGYAVQAVVIPACAVNAPHRRDRVFIIGHRNDVENPMCCGRLHGQHDIAGCEWNIWDVSTGSSERICGDTSGVCVPDPIRTGLEGQDQPRCGQGGQRVHLRRDPARCHRQDDAGRATAADPDCDRGSEMDEHLEPQFADGSKPVGDGMERIITNSKSEQGGRLRPEQPQCGEPQQGELGGRNKQVGRGGYAPNPDNKGLEGDTSQRVQGHSGRGQQREFCFATVPGSETGDTHAGCGRWDEFPTQSPVHRGNDGIPFPLDCLTISPSKWRTESLKAYGNAIVPQVMYEIFRAIEETENNLRQ